MRCMAQQRPADVLTVWSKFACPPPPAGASSPDGRPPVHSALLPAAVRPEQLFFCVCRGCSQAAAWDRGRARVSLLCQRPHPSVRSCCNLPALCLAAILASQPDAQAAGPAARGLAALPAGLPGGTAAAGQNHRRPAPCRRPAVGQLAEAEHAAQRRLHRRALASEAEAV